MSCAPCSALVSDQTHPRWLIAAATRIEPDTVQTELLRACLLEADLANESWQRFVALCGDARTYFEQSRQGIKGLLPFVESRLAVQSMEVNPEFRTYARVSLVREQLRSQIYQEVLTTIRRQLRSRGIEVVLLKGAALSQWVYPADAVRHNHGIELLVRETDLTKAIAALRNASCEVDQAQNSLRFARQPLPRIWFGGRRSYPVA